VVLVPSLGLLFTLYLRGRLDASEDAAGVSAAVTAGGSRAVATRARAWGTSAVVGLVAGTGLLVFADANWAHLAGVVCLVVCAVAVFLLAAPGDA
jgi:hypothetical protein